MIVETYVCKKVAAVCVRDHRCPLAIPHFHVARFTIRHTCPIDIGAVTCEVYRLACSFKDSEYSYGKEFGNAH